MRIRVALRASPATAAPTVTAMVVATLLLLFVTGSTWLALARFGLRFRRLGPLLAFTLRALATLRPIAAALLLLAGLVRLLLTPPFALLARRLLTPALALQSLLALDLRARALTLTLLARGLLTPAFALLALPLLLPGLAGLLFTPPLALWHLLLAFGLRTRALVLTLRTRRLFPAPFAATARRLRPLLRRPPLSGTLFTPRPIGYSGRLSNTSAHAGLPAATNTNNGRRPVFQVVECRNGILY